MASISTNRNALAKDVARARRQKAPRAARKNLQRAEQALRKKDEAAFYEALWNTLTDYFGHRLNLAPGEVSQAAVLARLPQQTEAIKNLFTTIEQHRYGIQSGEHKEDMKNLLKQTTATLRQCERIKR
jgi:hypothetical protein